LKAAELDKAAGESSARLIPLLRGQISQWKKGIDQAGGPTLEILSQPLDASRPDTRVAIEAEKLLILSWTLGMDHASPSVHLADDDLEAVSFDEAVRFMKSRIPMKKAEWRILEPQLRFRAFTLAALSKPDSIEAVRQSCIKAIKEGTPLSEFWQENTLFDTAGVGKSPWYWETVYRTNCQTAYNAGRAAEFVRSNPEYIELMGIGDSRQTEICRKLDGTTLPASHPFWKTHWPPFHFGCRTTPRGIYQEEVEANREADPSWGKSTKAPRVDPDDGFGGNPLDTESFYRLTPKMLERAEAYGILPDIKAFAEKLGLRFDPISTSRISGKQGVVAVKKDVPISPEKKQEFRKAATEKLQQYRDQSFVNKELKESILINRRGIEHASAYSGDPSKLGSLERLPDIIRNARGFTSAPEKHGNAIFIEVLTGKSVIEFNGKRNQFAVILKRRKNGDLVFYELTPWVKK
jgi:SPP1 gp7 family putative phage head morphogenesis protein